MYSTAVLFLLFAGLAGLIFTIYNRSQALRIAKPVNRFDHVFTRTLKVFLYAIGQKRFFEHGRISGILHAFIFWGFLAVALRTIILFGQGISSDFASSFLASPTGHFYTIFKDFFQILVVIGCLGMLIRRAFFKPARLTLSTEADVILITILALMITDFMMEAGIWYEFSYFTHIILILGFLNWLPYGKHFHIITSIPNVFFQRLTSGGAIDPLNLEDEKITSYGVNDIKDFDWKQDLDMFTCTECGRCQDQCPAFATDKPLSPKELTIALRDHLYERLPNFSSSPTIPADGSSSPSPSTGLINNIIKPDTIWACTTCKACETACPVFIEYVDKIIDMRRHQVLMEGSITPEAQTALRNMESNYNPWGIGYASRGDWTKGLKIKTFAEDANMEYLYFVGCAGSFDERYKKVAKAFAGLLQKAGVSFGILGAEEKCTGDSARRIGNEYLFQTLAKDNIATFKRYNIKKIITTCPHCYNTLKNEYPQFDGNYEVHHHTEFLLGLIKAGRLAIKRPLNDLNTQALKHSNTITYHDSCYLGRYNDIYTAPRELLELAGYDIKEPEETHDTGRCCGAGGGRMWMEEKIGTRINHRRLEDLQKTEAKNIATACPFCLTMMNDAIRDKHAEELQVHDVVEFLNYK